ncbi:hypothetical protein PFICI_01944 [Pestalotiopsis fici W106-1]|uniref:Uncharacterized protein n=1 Tax=Pestalotiopsis fici (strain W106-1 / CGMCC3.15140) TaxID=1229662 RepID=W3XSB2_PESFW|nr:uncharacterized protein PFICI_01944 [Pestalotiopsis fici W106-1]ETS88116.1 hypothetical protein PFICI_01944 [Pestalotiopsis fici W106-1]
MKGSRLPNTQTLLSIFSISILAIIVVFFLRSDIPYTPTLTVKSHLIQDYHHIVQDVEKSSIVMNFREHAEFKNLSHEYDIYWKNTRPPNGGYFAWLDETGTRRRDGISMFHQLHCLVMLREAMQGLGEEIQSLKAMRRDTAHEDHAMHTEHDDLHWLHCFDYLRQAILCNADSTFEPHLMNSNGKDIVDGMIERDCKDWSLLYKASEKSDFQSLVLDNE